MEVLEANKEFDGTDEHIKKELFEIEESPVKLETSDCPSDYKLAEVTLCKRNECVNSLPNGEDKCSFESCIDASIVHETDPNRKVTKEVGSRSCNSDEENGTTSLAQPVKSINYLRYGSDFCKIRSDTKMPFPSTTDPTRIAIYFSETKKKMMYYMGYSYARSSKRRKQYVLYDCSKFFKCNCPAKLKITFKEDAVELEGKHTCDNTDLVVRAAATNTDIDCGEESVDIVNDNSKESLADETVNYWIPITFKYRSVRKHLSTFVPKLDPNDGSSVTLFIESGQKILYYKGHRFDYHSRKHSVYPCSNSHNCYASIKVNKEKSALLELGAHTCQADKGSTKNISCSTRNKTTTNVKAVILPENSMISSTIPQSSQLSVECAESVPKSNTHTLASKSLEAFFKNPSPCTAKYTDVVVTNYMSTTFRSVSAQEQMDYLVAECTETETIKLMFKNYYHTEVPGKISDGSQTFACVHHKRHGCSGRVLIKDDKVVGYRDHFCMGNKSKDFIKPFARDEKTVAIYYQPSLCRPEAIFRNFAYWKFGNSKWMCTKKRDICNAYLTITGDTVMEFGNHICVVRAERPGFINTKKFPPWPPIVEVVDEVNCPCLIYGGFVYSLHNKIDRTWLCVKRESSKCQGCVRINDDNISMINKHICFEDVVVDVIPPVTRTKRFSLELDRQENLLMFRKVFKKRNTIRYAMHKGYIYQNTGKGSRWDCVYGGAFYSCRGVMTMMSSTNQVAVSKHSCKVYEVGIETEGTQAIEKPSEEVMESTSENNVSLNCKDTLQNTEVLVEKPSEEVMESTSENNVLLNSKDTLQNTEVQVDLESTSNTKPDAEASNRVVYINDLKFKEEVEEELLQIEFEGQYYYVAVEKVENVPLHFNIDWFNDKPTNQSIDLSRCIITELSNTPTAEKTILEVHEVDSELNGIETIVTPVATVTAENGAHEPSSELEEI